MTHKKSKVNIVILSICIVSMCFVWFAGNNKSFEKANASCASSMIVLEASTNRILDQQNAYAKRYMASTTKILTAITVIKNCDLSSQVTITKESVGVEGSSIYLEVGEKITVRDLLYGLMLQSGNDAATALAIHVGGSVAKFADMMNDTAKQAGANNSNFVNPHGLHNDNHYTTAYDLALITTYALKNNEFKKISATKTHYIDRPQKQWKHAINNKNKILHTFDGGDGVKTGFTKKAGRCLVSSATRGGMQVVCVVLNCGPMFEECRALMKTAFQNYTITKVIGAYEYSGVANVKNGRTSQVGAYSHRVHCYPLREDELQNLTKLVEFDELVAPIAANQKIGQVKVMLHNRLLFCEDLYSIEEVRGITVMDRLRELLPDWRR